MKLKEFLTPMEKGNFVMIFLDNEPQGEFCTPCELSPILENANVKSHSLYLNECLDVYLVINVTNKSETVKDIKE